MLKLIYIHTFAPKLNPFEPRAADCSFAAKLGRLVSPPASQRLFGLPAHSTCRSSTRSLNTSFHIPSCSHSDRVRSAASITATKLSVMGVGTPERAPPRTMGPAMPSSSSFRPAARSFAMEARIVAG
jgi:hypothetical protein